MLAISQISAQDPYLMALAEMQSGDYVKAASQLDDLILSDGSNAAAYLKRAESLYLLGKYDDAINDLKIANSLKTDCGEFLMACSHARSGQNMEAVISLEKHLKSGYKKPGQSSFLMMHF